MILLTQKWFPGQLVTEERLGNALWLEKDQQEKQTIAVTNGIARAFGKG